MGSLSVASVMLQCKKQMHQANSPHLLHFCTLNGRGERIRTSDPLLPKQVRYQAALRPELLVSNGVDLKMPTAKLRETFERCRLLADFRSLPESQVELSSLIADVPDV